MGWRPGEGALSPGQTLIHFFRNTTHPQPPSPPLRTGQTQTVGKKTDFCGQPYAWQPRPLGDQRLPLTLSPKPSIPPIPAAGGGGIAQVLKQPTLAAAAKSFTNLKTEGRRMMPQGPLMPKMTQGRRAKMCTKNGSRSQTHLFYFCEIRLS